MPNANNDTTNYWTVVAANHALADLVGVDAFYHTGVNAGHYVTCENLNMSASPASCQFQYDNGTYVFCIGLDLRQTGNHIEARTGKMRNWHMQKTLYESGVVYYGIDFYNYSTTTTPKRNTYGGYGESDSVSTKGLKNLRLRFATGGVVYAAASTAQNGHDLKFSGSADAPLAVRTSTSTAFPSNGVVTVAPYAELKLAGHVSNAQWTQYRVLTNGTLRLKGTSQTVRTDEVWWHDFLFFVKTVEENGMRTWMWSDYGWHHDDFVSKCPKSVLQSNWYYNDWMVGFDASKIAIEMPRKIVELFAKLEKAGFDQVPCGSNWKSREMREAKIPVNDSIMQLVKLCRSCIAPERLKGFMIAPWADCTMASNATNLEGIDLLSKAIGQK